MSVQNLLDRLEKVKQIGQGRWMACCPAHDDNSPSMSVTDRDGKILVKCFSNHCPAIEIVHAVGLELQDLFEGDKPWYFSDADRKERYSASQQNRQIQEAMTFLLIVQGWIEEGQKLTVEQAKKAHKMRQYLQERRML